MTYPDSVKPSQVIAWAAAGLACLVLLISLIVGSWAALAAFGRYQSRQHALNGVRISAIEIKNQEQRVLIAKQKADIRLQDAVGVREAQDEIAKTLTPLYVQFEMVDALRQIAQSGRNNSVVYIPSGANGIPLVATANGQQVGQPDQAGK